jgi:hypothetical protein
MSRKCLLSRSKALSVALEHLSQLNMLNVGVDVHHFTPVPVSEIPFWLKKIKSFSDDDVYACYMDSNLAYLGKRGTPGVYFKKRQ